jgi:hypothetical protein
LEDAVWDLKEDMTGVEGTIRVQDISRADMSRGDISRVDINRMDISKADISRADMSRMKDMIRVKDTTRVAVTMTNTRKGDKSPVDIMNG